MMPSFLAWGWEGQGSWGRRGGRGEEAEVSPGYSEVFICKKRKNHSWGSSKDDKEITDIRELYKPQGAGQTLVVTRPVLPPLRPSPSPEIRAGC